MAPKLGLVTYQLAKDWDVDTMIANQRACTASLVHYVIGDEGQILSYCDQLRRSLERWDEALPHHMPRAPCQARRVGRARRGGQLLSVFWSWVPSF